MPSARKPLVLDENNEIQQLQSGDTLAATIAGGDVYNLKNTSGSTMIEGTAVYAHTVAGEVKISTAEDNSPIEKARTLGLVVQTYGIANNATGAIHLGGPMSLPTTTWDPLTGDTGGLTPGKVYFLKSESSGAITKIPPTGPGEWVVRIGTAISTTTLMVNIQPPIKL